MAASQTDSGHPHPLLLDLVLEQIFQYLDLETIIVTRQVSRQWWQLSSKFLKRLKLPKVEIQNSSDLYCFISTALATPSPVPWRHFRLDYFGEDLTKIDKQLFIRTFSNSLEDLDVMPGTGGDLMDLFIMLVRDLPRLRSLRLEALRALVTNQLNQSVSHYLRFDYGVNRIAEFLSWYQSVHPKPKFPNLWEFSVTVQIEMDTSELSQKFFAAILQMMPAIRSLSFSCLDMNAVSTTSPGLIHALMNSPLPAQLTSLRIDDLDDQSLCILSQEKTLKVKRLSLISIFHDVHEESVAGFLLSQAQSLEELSIGGQYSCGGDQLKLRIDFTMPYLKTLNFVGGLHIGTHFEHLKVISWEDISFQQFPSLETLGLVHLTEYTMNYLFPARTPILNSCNSVKILNFSGGMESIDPAKVLTLGRLFPCVENLHITVDNPLSISNVFTAWPGLKSLTFHIIAMIHGLDFHFSGKCLSAPKEHVYNLNLLPRSDQTKAAVSILILQDLEKLDVHMDLKHGRGTTQPVLRPNAHSGFDMHELLTDTTAMSLMELKHLKCLRINRSRLSPHWVRTLRKELGLKKCVIGDIDGHIVGITDPLEVLAAGFESEEEYFSANEI